MKKLLISVFAVLATSVLSGAPKTISYQGYLTDSFGNPVADGSHNVTFSIYSTVSGGSAAWSELRNVTTENGLFSTVLGESSPIPDSAITDSAAYLEIAIDPDPPLSPRVRLTSVPYSLSSSMLQNSVTDPSSGETGDLFIGSDPAATSKAAKTMRMLVIHTSTSDSASTETFVSNDSGVIETTTAKSGSSHATGHRQHKPLAITRELDVIGLGNIVNLQSQLGADTGFSETRKYLTADGEVEVSETGHAHGHLDYLKKVGDPATGNNSERTLSFDPDNGFAIAFQAETATAKLTGKRQHRPVAFTKEMGATLSLDSTKWHTYLSADSGFVDSVRMNKADLISDISHGTNQTKEHVLLSRQVGVSGASTNSKAELQTNDSSAVMDMHHTDGIDSSEVRASANESAAISSLRTLVSSQARSATALEYGLIGLASSSQSSTSHYQYDAIGRTISQTTKVAQGKFDAVATQINSAGPSGPGLFDSSMILTTMDSVRMLHALFVNGDTAATTDASTDKRKQSLYFPETMLEAIEMLVETNQAAIRLFSINPASGMQDSNIVIRSNGDLTMTGELSVGGGGGLSANSQSMTVPRLTTSQRDGLTAENGMIIYNISTNQFNFFENGAWVTK